MAGLMLPRTVSVAPNRLTRLVTPSRPTRAHNFSSTASVSSSASGSTSKSKPFDVVIVGGGPAGLSLAAALGSASTSGDALDVAVVESGDLSRISRWSEQPHLYTNRVSSITNASRQFLDDIGAWDHVDESRTAPVENMEVWDGMSNARITFSNTDVDANLLEMARLTENLNLQRGLLRRLDEMPDRVSLIHKTKVESISRDEPNSWPEVHLSDGSSLQARLLVGADGFNSPVRRFAEIDSYGWSYPTHAVVATLLHQSIPTTITPDDPYLSSLPRRNSTAYQRFLPTGPIAFLPLSPAGDISSLVWSTTPQLASILKAVRPEVLALLVNAAFRLPDLSLRYLNAQLVEMSRAIAPNEITPEQIAEQIRFREESDGITDESPLFSSSTSELVLGVPPVGSESYPPLIQSIQPGTQASFPLKLSHADTYVSDRIALIGDAAHTVHPLAGQGLNMGLGDAQSLSETIMASLELGGDIGSYTQLMPYHQDRYAPNHAILSVTDKLHKLYALDNAPAVWARSVGLEVLNELGPVKGAMMGAAGASVVQRRRNGEDGPEYGARGAERLMWGAAAGGMEGLNSAVQLGKMLSGGLRSTATSLVENLARSVVDATRSRQ